MKILMGPVLSLRRADAEHWHVSALVVAAKTAAPEPLSVECIGPHDEAMKAPATELWVHGDQSVYRYDMKIRRDANRATRVDYRFAGTPRPWSFHVPAAAGKPRMAFVSCNGFSSAGEIKKVKDKNHLWTRMAALHAKDPYNVLVMGGDQVYADPIWEACPAIKDWVETPFETRKRRRFSSAMAAQVKRFYFNLYRDRWHQPEVEGMLSSAPTVMMWDDHDIFDGWGSYNPETQNCAVYEGIFDIARNHFAVFQQQVDPRAAEDHPSKVTGQEGFTLALDLGDYAVLAVDARSERTQARVLARETWDAIWAWTDRLRAADVRPKHLLVVLAVPVLHADFGRIETLMGWLPGEQELEDDLRDHWQSPGHRKERLRLIHRLLDLMADTKIRATILSGDVHVACLGVIRSERSGMPGARSSVINQLTSSGIVHPPPPKLFGHLLDQLSDTPEPIDEGIEGAMLAFPTKRKKFVLARNFLSLEPDERNDRLWANWYVEGEEREPATKVIGRA
ncbi:MAG: alkaline phosphatase D family protein [Acidobacteria bacterium]|nr:alkaline phosphatase D family protein [Acidobacteriota bacterium]